MPDLTRYEMETVINFNQEEDSATVYTASKSVYNRMVKRGYTAERLDEDSWRFIVPKKEIRLPSKPRKLSQESLERLKTRMRKVRS